MDAEHRLGVLEQAEQGGVEGLVLTNGEELCAPHGQPSLDRGQDGLEGPGALGDGDDPGPFRARGSLREPQLGRQAPLLGQSGRQAGELHERGARAVRRGGGEGTRITPGGDGASGPGGEVAVGLRKSGLGRQQHGQAPFGRAGHQLPVVLA